MPKKTDISSLDEILTSKTLLDDKVAVEEANYKKLKTEIKELRRFKQMAEKFLADHSLKDYFRKAFIQLKNPHGSNVKKPHKKPLFLPVYAEKRRGMHNL